MTRWQTDDVEVAPAFTASIEDIRRAAKEGRIEESIDALCVIAEYQERSYERMMQLNERLVATIDKLTKGMVPDG